MFLILVVTIKTIVLLCTIKEKINYGLGYFTPEESELRRLRLVEDAFERLKVEHERLKLQVRSQPAIKITDQPGLFCGTCSREPWQKCSCKRG